MFHSNDVDKKNKPQNSVFIHLVFKDVREGPVESTNQQADSGAEAEKMIDYSSGEVKDGSPVEVNETPSNDSSQD